MRKVSIISVFYNEEKYIQEFLESILMQTYSNIELICVDDGSVDMSKNIVREYISVFEQNGMKLRYYYQSNQGQAVATSFALKKIEGDYLCWVDADDFLYPDSVKKRVEYLEMHKECGMVVSDFDIINEDNRQITEKKGEKYGKLNYHFDQFELAIAGETIIENLAYMIRVECLKKVNPNMDVLNCREGQNYQIVLPMLYYYKRGYIDESLGCYRVHNDSHSHRKRNSQELIERYDSLIEMLTDILMLLDIDEDRVLHLVKRSTFSLEKGKVFEEYAGD